MATAIYLERGKVKTFACAVEWPGWCRSGKGDEAAVEALAAYAERYAPVVRAAGLAWPRKATDFDVVATQPGTGATDFGIPEKPSALDDRPLSAADARRLAKLVEASLVTFDEVAAAAPATLQKGPRGGGRDRDEVIEHVLGAELGYYKRVGERDRDGFLAALRAARAPVVEGHRGKPWPWRYAARRVAWHALDHAWEIEDKS
jgi:hypothetical protein